MLHELRILHGDLQVILSTGEEVGLLGAEALAPEVVAGGIGFVFDASGETGSIITSAPAHDVLEVEVCGRAAHAGFAPEKGVSALQIAARAVASMRLGRIDAMTTANLGTLHGGIANNVVAPQATLTLEARSRDFEGACALVAAEMAKRSTAEWIAALEQADIPVQRMNTLDDIVGDPHLNAIGYFQSVEHPTEGRIRAMAVPSEWSESAPEYRRHAPRLGEHTREVLRETGLQDDAIEQLIASGAAQAAA